MIGGRLCKCGLHHRRDAPFPPAIWVDLHTEDVCTTQAGDWHTSYRPGRQYGVIHLRVPAWVTRFLVTKFLSRKAVTA